MTSWRRVDAAEAETKDPSGTRPEFNSNILPKDSTTHSELGKNGVALSVKRAEISMIAF